MSKTIVIFDTEFTSWKDARESSWGAPGYHREIIQIAARRWEQGTDWCEGETFCSFVRPQLTPKLSGFIRQLTGVKQKEVANAPSALEAFQAFKKFAKAARCYSNGNDINPMAETAGLQGFKLPMPVSQFSTLYPWLYNKVEKVAGKFDRQKNSSGTMYKLLGLTLPSNKVHDAMHDVDSICAAIEELGRKRIKISQLWED